MHTVLLIKKTKTGFDYLIFNRWQAEDGGVDPAPKSRNVNDTGVEEGATVRILISDLMPGVKYVMEIQTVSYNLHSDTTKLSTRTSKLIHLLCFEF